MLSGRLQERVRLYIGTTGQVVAKSVSRQSGELYFQLHAPDVCQQGHEIFLTPLHIIYNQDDVTLVYPFGGQDTLTLAKSNFWTEYEHITLSMMEHLIDQLRLFHAVFMMAMGDIKPDNIVYNSATGAVRYIDLEYATAQLSTVPVVGLVIVVPEPQTRHYNTVTTPWYSSFEKRCGTGYCVYKNDAYALATTLYCLLTNHRPPGSLFPSDSVLSIETDRVRWETLHTSAFRSLLFQLETVLMWNAVDVVQFIRVHWSVNI
jgi:serine/threonine protein kinase